MVYEISGGASAALAIINDSKDDNTSDNIRFHGFLQFNVRDRAVPPFLPTFDFTIKRKNYLDLRHHIDELNQFFDKSRPYDPEGLYQAIQETGEKIVRMDKVLGMIIEKIIINTFVEELVIYTNDEHIPFHWSNVNDTFLCDAKSTGIIWIDDLNRSFVEYLRSPYPQQEIRSQDSLEDQLEGNFALLLGGCGGADGRPYLPKVAEELAEMERIFSEKEILYPLEVKNLFAEAGCNDESSAERLSQRDLLLEYFSHYELTKRIRLIHYSGHIEKAVGEENPCLIISGDKPLSRADFFPKKFPLKPLVFLNGCRSAGDVSVFEKSASLATKLLDQGASGVIVTTMPTDDDSSYRMSVEFYEALFSKAQLGYGKALKFAKERLGSSPMRLLFLLYGDPSSRLAYPPDDIEYAETLTLLSSRPHT